MANLLEMDLNSFGFDIDVTKKLPGWDDFTEALDQMDMYVSPMLYIETADVDYSYEIMQEAVRDAKTIARQKRSSISNRSGDTTKDMLAVHGDVTTAGGDLLYTTWGLCKTGLDLIGRLITFIAGNLSKVPKMADTVLKKMIELPSDIRNKIRGNFNLNIDYNSLGVLYNDIMDSLDRFIANAGNVVKGDSWTTLFDGLANPQKMSGMTGKFKSLFTAESSKIKDMEKVAKSLQSFNISPTNIDCNNPKNIEAYFSSAGSVDVIIEGRREKLNYYEALQDLNKMLSRRHEDIKELMKACNTKFNKTVANEGFGQLSDKQQKLVQGIIKNISVVFTVVGKLVKAILEDMNTLFQQYKKIQKRYNCAENKDIEDGIENKSDVKEQMKSVKKDIKKNT